MKLTFFPLLIIISHASFSQDCKTRALNKPTESVRFQDDYTRSAVGPKITINVARLKPQLTTAETWVKNLLKNFTGAKLAYSNNYYFDLAEKSLAGQFYRGSGVKGYYSSQMRFYAYYCYDNNEKIFTEDECGSFLEIYFNNVLSHYLIQNAFVHTINGIPAFEMLEKSKTEGRVDYYEQLAMSNVYDTIYKSKNEFIIIRNSDKPVFIPVSRKDYLKQLLLDVEEYRNREISYAKADYTPAKEAANKADLEAQLKRIDNSKTYTTEQMAPYRKRLLDGWETEKQKYEKRMDRIEAEAGGAKNVILEYLKKPEDWLALSIKRFYSYNTYSPRGMGEYLDGLDVFSYSKEDETRTIIASINPAYYNNSISAEIPQSIMIALNKGTYPHMKIVGELIDKPGVFTALENILKTAK